MDVSVIVSVYNQADTVGRALESVLHQDFSGSMEVIIGDDASTDGTKAVCRSYAERFPGKVRYVRRERNLGIVGNYYGCISLCRGKYIADCAGDDFWSDSSKLTKEFEVMEGDGDITLVHTGWVYCDKSGGNVRVPDGLGEVAEVSAPGEWTTGVLRRDRGRSIHLCTAMYRASTIKGLIAKHPELFVDKSFTCEDLQIEVMLASVGKIAYLPCRTLCYSVISGSVSHRTEPAADFRQNFGVLQLQRRLQRFLQIDDGEMLDCYRERVKYLANKVFNSGDAELRDELERFVNGLALSQPAKTRVYMTVMRVPMLWSVARVLARVFSGGVYQRRTSE